MAGEVGGDLAACSKARVEASIGVIASKCKVEIGTGVYDKARGNEFPVRLHSDGVRHFEIDKVGGHFPAVAETRIKFARRGPNAGNDGRSYECGKRGRE